MRTVQRMVCALSWLLASCSLAPAVAPSATSTYPQATPALIMPTASAQDTVLPPTPAPVSLAGNLAGFRDNLAVADQFLLALTNMPAPPDGQGYQGWLLGDDGTVVSIGMLSLDADGNAVLAWISPNGENLLSRYARVQVTLEPAPGSASPTGAVTFAGVLEGAALTNARRLFVKNDGEPATPLNTAFALGLLAQTDLAAQHVANAGNAAAIGALAEMRAHLEHVVNILEGASGPRFDDHDGNGTAENPGDGFGVVGYARQIAELLSGQERVSTAAAGVQAQSAAVQDGCLAILKLEDAAAAATQLSELRELADQLKTDLAAGLYRAAQDAVRFEVAPVQ